MHQKGSVQLVREGDIPRKVDLWLPFDSTKGYLKVRDVLDALDWDDVFYIDEKGFEIQITAREYGELQGLSTEIFDADQILKVYGRKFFGNGDPGAALCNTIAAIQDGVMKPSLLEENDDFRVIMTLLGKVTTIMTEVKELFDNISKFYVV